MGRASMSGGQGVVEVLRSEGVDTIFGLIGSATMELLDALYGASDIRYIGVRDERTGTHMADGYARVSGRPGVMMAGQNGPGTTNLVTGVAQALRAYSPVVTLAGAIASGHLYKDAFQEIDQHALFAPITKKTYTVTSTGHLQDVAREAFRVATSPRTGPVHVNLPRDILGAVAEYSDASELSGSTRASFRAAGEPEAVERAARMLAEAKRPLILAGAGIKWGGRYAETLRLADLLACPVAASAGHGDAVPTDHELAAGQVGPRGNTVATRLMKEADVILVLGSRLGFNSTFFSYENLNPQAALIHNDTEPSALGRYFPIRIGIVADAPTLATQLTMALRGHEPGSDVTSWTRRFKDEKRQLWEARRRSGDDDSLPISPKRAFHGLRESIPRDAIVTLDAGTLCLQATDVLHYRRPPALITPLDFGLVGFSFAAGLGAKLAAPDRPVVSLMGDGGFGMTLTELSTAVSCRINTTVVVLNNGCWGAEKSYQKDFFGERYIGADLHNPDFAQVAESYGAGGYTVEEPGNLEKTLSTAIEDDRPTVVDVHIDPDALYSFRRDSFAGRSGASQS